VEMSFLTRVFVVIVYVQLSKTSTVIRVNMAEIQI